ncbi:hypothetical protein TBLA_0A07270 [Henningerozyma blattae CBS 6284]|uniref:SGTA homodimerisation domain-containing protein n=1 Tax=Henningerozyma blattae (strain ATCC 34711 / CBS 6284 / DSM 70876 / NBRC 10599 / NRRL Y-10934 / UCD 77-7) TaxID=1071380 RepID=I2GWL4_HENB6|nr:hypothetical protein TBLA_0A07270 [Tetrapisispora blattae CBS 6284]CCH58516.1 hypothetical protein TBLA_0A07270 [Tetrapisispora blattae CBS 6284]
MSTTQINDKDVACLIVNFLENVISKKEISQDNIDSLNVAIDCIQQCYNLNEAYISSSLILKFSKSDLTSILNNFAKNNYKNITSTKETTPLTLEPSSLNESVKKNQSNISNDNNEKISINLNDTSKNNFSDKDKQIADTFKDEGNRLMFSEDYKKAIECYTNAISKYPCDPIYYSNRSVAYLKVNDYESAINDANFCISIDANFSKAYIRLANIKVQQHQYIDALDYYKKFIELNKDSVPEKITREFEDLKLKVQTDISLREISNDHSNNNYNENSYNSTKNSPDIGSILGDGFAALLSNPMLQQMIFKIIQNNPDAAKNIGYVLANPAMKNLLQNFKNGSAFDKKLFMDLLDSLLNPNSNTNTNPNNNSNTT